MDLSRKLLSDIIVYDKYAKYLPEKETRESWDQAVQRTLDHHCKRYPFLKDEIGKAFKSTFERDVFPSMRFLQFGGKPIEVNPCRGFNCSFRAANDITVFNEAMFLLLGGTGLGYSVQRHHVDQLPAIVGPNRKKTRRFLIADNIEGWSDAVKVLIESYVNNTSQIIFDYSDIRPAGTPIKTAGGKAPGPEPLKDCLHNLTKILDRKAHNEKLKPIETHDMICHIADAVLSGGIRRSACIALFSLDDEEMLTCKFGNWWEQNPQRGRSNNSVVLLRSKITKKVFDELWFKIKISGSGEPGFFFTDDIELGTNPCAEISLRANQFCNLVSVDISRVQTDKELFELVERATIIGTLQASYTDFHYLSEKWKDVTEKEALLGVSLTGTARKDLKKFNFKKAAKIVVATNKKWAKLLKINSSARMTCVKPDGTVSLVAGSSSGIHAWWNEYYIRRITLLKDSALYKYLLLVVPKLIEDNILKPSKEAFITIPIKAPEGAITRNSESAIDLLERVKLISTNWITPGHVTGLNKHNVSTTVTIKPDEWDSVGEWMWKNRKYYAALSVLPHDTGTYFQTPFEDIDEATYNGLLKYVKDINLSDIKENADYTTNKDSVACGGGGGGCEIK